MKLFAPWSRFLGVLYCGICGRRMQASWNNDAADYRCVFLREYAAKNKISHSRAVYLRVDQLISFEARVKR
jgi:site-specific DNA recombinase